MEIRIKIEQKIDLWITSLITVTLIAVITLLFLEFIDLKSWSTR